MYRILDGQVLISQQRILYTVYKVQMSRIVFRSNHWFGRCSFTTLTKYRIFERLGKHL